MKVAGGAWWKAHDDFLSHVQFTFLHNVSLQDRYNFV
jgi:hypothetical protein